MHLDNTLGLYHGSVVWGVRVSVYLSKYIFPKYTFSEYLFSSIFSQNIFFSLNASNIVKTTPPTRQQS